MDFVYRVILFTIIAWFLLVPINKFILIFFPPWESWKVRLPIAVSLGIAIASNYYTIGIIFIAIIGVRFFIKIHE